MSRCLLCGGPPLPPVLKLRQGAQVCRSCLAERDNRLQAIRDTLAKRKTSERGGYGILAILGVLLLLGGPLVLLAGLAAVVALGLLISWVTKSKSNEELEAELRAVKQELQPVYDLWWDYPPDWWDRRQEVMARDRLCRECGRRMSGSRFPFHVHHVVPLSSPEATHKSENLVLLCEICHAKKPGHEVVAEQRRRRLGRVKRQ